MAPGHTAPGPLWPGDLTEVRERLARLEARAEVRGQPLAKLRQSGSRERLWNVVVLRDHYQMPTSA